MIKIRVNSWNEVNDCLYAASWQEPLGRWRSHNAFRGMSAAMRARRFAVELPWPWRSTMGCPRDCWTGHFRRMWPCISPPATWIVTIVTVWYGRSIMWAANHACRNAFTTALMGAIAEAKGIDRAQYLLQHGTMQIDPQRSFCISLDVLHAAGAIRFCPEQHSFRKWPACGHPAN